MLLTVIAVATLLVAVVGATFAYFSLTATGESKTTGTITTPKIGTATITGENNTLTLNLTAEDMVKGVGDKIYYASASGDSNKTTGNAINIAKVDLKGAQENAEYSCKTTVTVSVSGTMKDSLQAGWATLKLTGSGATEPDASNIDIKDIVTSGGTYTGTAVVKATTAGQSPDTDGYSGTANILSAVLSFTNKVDAPQNDVAGKTLTVTINVTGGECTLQTGD